MSPHYRAHPPSFLRDQCGVRASTHGWNGLDDEPACGIAAVTRACILALCVFVVACEERGAQPATPSSPSATLGTAATGDAAPQRTAHALRDGDLVFHESTSRQSEMVRALTRSRWTHMGVVFLDPSGPVVLEAVSPVKYTPLRSWIARGRDKRYVVKRLRDVDARLPADTVRKMRGVAAAWLGRPYDLQFRWGDDALYCSELAYKLFERGASVRIGKLQRAREMNLTDERVQRAQSARFGAGQFDPNEIIVTPASMYDDPQLVTVPDAR